MMMVLMLLWVLAPYTAVFLFILPLISTQPLLCILLEDSLLARSFPPIPCL
jgi:hypothetical protein